MQVYSVRLRYAIWFEENEIAMYYSPYLNDVTLQERKQ